MASYSSILRINKPIKNLNRGIQKDNELQNGILIEKIYCDRTKGRKSSNIRLVDSSAADSVKCGEENNIIKSTNADLTTKADTNKENVDVGNPKIVQTLETTHTFVTNSTGSYLLQTKKETQSIFNDLSEFPILGTNKSIKRDTPTHQSPQLSPYAEPFVFTRSIQGNTIYNAFRNFNYNEEPIEYDPDTVDVEDYSDNYNNIDEHAWNTTEQGEAPSPGAQYEIPENDDDTNFASISLSRRKYLSKLSVDAKPFEFKGKFTKTDNVSELSISNGSAVAPVRANSRSPSLDTKPFVPGNDRLQNMYPGYCVAGDNVKKEYSADYEERSVSHEDRNSGSTSEKTIAFPSRSRFDIQSRNYRCNRKAATEITEDAKQLNSNCLYASNHISKSPDRSYIAKDIPAQSTGMSKKTGISNLSVDAKPFASNSSSGNGMVTIKKREDKEQNDDATNKKKYPLIPLPSNSSKPSKLRPDAQSFSIPKSKDETVTENLENRNSYVKTNDESNRTRSTLSTLTARNGSESSPSKSLQEPHISNQNGDRFEPGTRSDKSTDNASNKNIVSWRRGALSKLGYSLDEAPKNDSNETKKPINNQSSESRRSVYSSESQNRRTSKLSPGAQPFSPTIKDRNIINKTKVDSKLVTINYGHNSYIPYTPQHWSNEEGPPINSNTLNNYSRNVCNGYSENQISFRQSFDYLQKVESEIEKSALKKTSAFSNTSDSQMKTTNQQKDHVTRQINTVPAPKTSSEFRPYSRDSCMVSNIYATNRVCAPHPELASPPFSNDFRRNSIEKNINQRDRWGQEVNDFKQYKYGPCVINSNCNNNEKIDDKVWHTEVPQIHQTYPPYAAVMPKNKISIEQRIQSVNTPPVMHQILNTPPANHQLRNSPPLNQVLNTPPVNHRAVNHPPVYHNILHTQTLNNHVPFSGKYIPSYMNSAFQFQTPANVSKIWNPRVHPGQLIPNRMALPNSHINPTLLPTSGRQFESPIKFVKPVPLTHGLENRFPKDHSYENPDRNINIVERNLTVNNGINNSPPSWSANYAKDFNDFLDMYTIKLTSQMIPVVQGDHVIRRNLQSPHGLQKELILNKENKSSNYFNAERKDNILRNSQLDRSIVHPENTIKTTAEQPNTVTERIDIQQKNKLSALPKENAALLIPPPIPPRRKINLNNNTEKCISQAASTTPLPVIAPSKNIFSIRNMDQPNELLQEGEAKRNSRDSKDNLLSGDSSLKYEVQNSNASKNPFLTDYIPVSTREICISSNLDQFPQEAPQNTSLSNYKQKRGNNPFIDNEFEDVDSSSASINRPVIDPPKDPLWFYLDPQDDVQGPFTSIEMAEWHHVGYFKDELKIRRNCDKRFICIGEFMKLTGSSSPFLDSQSIPPLDVEITLSRKCTNPFSEGYQAMHAQKHCDLYNS